jgi:integrase
MLHLHYLTKIDYMILNYTEPKLNKGKKPTHIPKGSTLAKEWAKNMWYISLTYKGKQYRIKNGINRIKNPEEKLYWAEVLLLSIKKELNNGEFSWANDFSFENVSDEKLTLAEAVERYLDDLKKYARPKTVGSYRSKLRYLVEAFPENELDTITSKELENYFHRKIHAITPAKIFIHNKSVELKKAIPWTQKTVKNARGVFSAFFSWCKEYGYLKGNNPVTEILAKRIKSEVEIPRRNVAFTEEDSQTIMNYLDENDKNVAYISRIMYYTLIRPGEICKLRVKNVNLETRTITVPLAVSKNTKNSIPEVVNIYSELYEILKNLIKEETPKDYFLVSKSSTLIGEEPLTANRAYKRFKKALTALGLDNKGYTFYSFKHFSNVQRAKMKWTGRELMKANRHNSTEMTDIYLVDLERELNIVDKPIPKL